MSSYIDYQGSAGKIWLARHNKEMMLDAGKTVIVCTPEGITKQRRKKHLTMIEEIGPSISTLMVIHDEL